MKCVDTTYIIHLLRKHEGALRKSEELDLEGNIITTEINVYELFYGIYKSKGIKTNKRIRKLNIVLDKLEILPLDHKASLKAAEIAGELSKKGLEIGSHDCMIAAIMLSNGCNTIITDNVEHFKRIKNLNVETY